MVTWDDEQTLDPDIEFRAERTEEIRNFGVLFRLAGLRGIAGEKDEVDGPFFLSKGFQISQPGVAEDAPPAPRLLLPRAFGMQIRNWRNCKRYCPYAMVPL